MRSQTPWYSKSEKNTKCFLSLEKRHFYRKTIKGLKLENPWEFEVKEVLQKLCTSSKPDLGTSSFPENIEEKLGDVQKESCKGKLKLEECL